MIFIAKHLNQMNKKILVLGSTSWLGSALLSRLNANKDEYQLITTVYKNKIELDADIKVIINIQGLKDFHFNLNTLIRM